MMTDADFRAKVLKKAADFFGDFAKRRVPERPDVFVSELLATACAALVGADVPPPLPMLALLPAVGRSNGYSPKKLADMIPHARTLLMAQGNFNRTPSDKTCLVYAAFTTHPESELRSRVVAEMTGLAGSMAASGYCQHLVKAGALVAVRRGYYKLAELS